MKKKISAALKFAESQRRTAKHKLEVYSSGHWIDPKEENRVLEHAGMIRNECESNIIIWDWIIDTLKKMQ